MKTSVVSFAMLALGGLAAGSAAALGPFPFALDPAASGFTWSATSNQGVVTGASQAFHLEGTVDVELAPARGGGFVGRFTGADAAIEPGVFGSFPGQAAGGFELTGARLSLVSEAFAIAPDGTFTTAVAPSFLDGELYMAPPLGPGVILILDGRPLRRVRVSGTLKPQDALLRLEVPIQLTFDFSGGAVSGSLDMPGTLSARLRRGAR